MLPAWSIESIDDLVPTMRENILACMPSSMAELTLDVLVREDGTVAATASDVPIETTTRVCIDAVLVRVWLRASVPNGTTLQLRFAR